jgi:hypothetical protein
LGVYTRKDSSFYWLWLEGPKIQESTGIPVLRNGTAKQKAALRRAAEARYVVRMLEIAEQETANRRVRPGLVIVARIDQGYSVPDPRLDDLLAGRPPLFDPAYHFAIWIGVSWWQAIGCRDPIDLVHWIRTATTAPTLLR